MKLKLIPNISLGPASLIAAAFIGPGTVTVCTLAGVNYGFELLWALTFSIIATVVLQEMSARVGIVSGMGLGASLRKHLTIPILKFLALFLVLSAILIGNAAYEAGNISGAIIGVEYFIPGQTSIMGIIIGLLAGGLLFIGNIKTLEKTLIFLVIVMSLCFIVTAIATKPNILQLIKGIFTPTIDWDNILFITGLVGTTVVPYNLFLHASLAKDKWKSEDMGAMRSDTFVSIFFGGLVSMAIIISAASLQGSGIENAEQLGKSLEPLLGQYSGILISIGLFSAGLTSAITAPLAAAYATEGILGWSGGSKSLKFRMVWVAIIITGIVFSTLGIKPLEIIKFAQITNGMLLPLIVIFLLYVINLKDLMGKYKNNNFQNIISGVVLIICIGLSVRTMLKIFG
jgi:Mn2+/Fe2+ NRAMP family transporter